MVSLSNVVAVNEEQVAAKVMDGEAILINLGTGAYYSIGATGGFIWSLLERRLSLRDIVDTVLSHYDAAADQVSADLLKLVDELRTEGLVNVASDTVSIGTPPAPSGTRQPYESPAIEKYTDMAEMFALDPPLPGLSNAGAGGKS